MPPASRVTRGSLAAAEDLATLSSRDRLIFAQAVYEYGARQPAWAEIAKLLSKHPLISRPKNFFTAQSCVAIYNYLMKEAELERFVFDVADALLDLTDSKKSTDLCEAKKSPVNAQLAQRYYRDRVTELRDEIAAEEERFKTLVTEIEEIRAGSWDEKILSKINGADVPLDIPPATPTKTINIEAVEPTPVDGGDTPAQVQQPAGEEQPTEAPGIQVAESDGEAPMDVSSPVRASPPPPESSLREETPKIPEEQIVELPSANSAPASPVPEVQSPKSPKQMPKTRSQTRKEPSEAPETPAATETIDKEEKQVTDKQDEQEEVQKEEIEEVVESVQHTTPEEGTPERTMSREGEPAELNSHESTPAPQERKGGKRRASDVDATDSSRDKKRPREESESMDNADSPATPSAMPSGIKNTKERKRFQSVITMLHAQITAHRNGTIFHHPIKPSEAPDYQDIVKRPMDLKTIKNRVRDGRISTSSEYQRDIYLMFANSLMYNRPNSDIYVMAEEMMLDSEAEIQNFQQTEAYNLRTRN